MNDEQDILERFETQKAQNPALSVLEFAQANDLADAEVLEILELREAVAGQYKATVPPEGHEARALQGARELLSQTPRAQGRVAGVPGDPERSNVVIYLAAAVLLAAVGGLWGVIQQNTQVPSITLGPPVPMVALRKVELAFPELQDGASLAPVEDWLKTAEQALDHHKDLYNTATYARVLSRVAHAIGQVDKDNEQAYERFKELIQHPQAKKGPSEIFHFAKYADQVGRRELAEQYYTRTVRRHGASPFARRAKAALASFPELTKGSYLLPFKGKTFKEASFDSREWEGQPYLVVSWDPL